MTFATISLQDQIELAIRIAASQMPNHQARAFRLLADEIRDQKNQFANEMNERLTLYRKEQDALDV